MKKMTLPDFLAPWLDHFYEPLEIDLLQILADKPFEKNRYERFWKRTIP